MQNIKLAMRISEALSDNPDPTPGYFFDEFAKVTFQSSEDAVHLLESFLKKLKNSTSPYVKQKTLKMIKMVAEKGHPSFQKELQHRVSELKACAAFRGPADPIHGDMLNQRVRDAAKQAIDVAYGSSSGGLARTHSAGTGDFKGVSHYRGQPESPLQTKYSPVQVLSDNQFGFASSSPAVTQPTSATSSGGGGFDPDVSAIEQAVRKVTDDCKTTTPERIVLSEFVATAQAMNVAEVCMVLEERLDDKAKWQNKLRALCAIEHLIVSGVSEAVRYFTDNPDLLIKSYRSAVQETVKTRARKVLTSLEINPDTQPRKSSTPPATQSHQLPARAQVTFSDQQQPPAERAPPVPAAGVSFAGMVVKTNAPDAKKSGSGLKTRKPKTSGDADAHAHTDDGMPSLIDTGVAPSQRTVAEGVAPSGSSNSSSSSSGDDMLSGFFTSAKPPPPPAPVPPPQAAVMDTSDPSQFFMSNPVNNAMASTGFDDIFGTPNLPQPSMTLLPSSSGAAATTSTSSTPAPPPSKRMPSAPKPAPKPAGPADPFAALLDAATNPTKAATPATTSTATSSGAPAAMPQLLSQIQSQAATGSSPSTGAAVDSGMSLLASITASATSTTASPSPAAAVVPATIPAPSSAPTVVAPLPQPVAAVQTPPSPSQAEHVEHQLGTQPHGVDPSAAAQIFQQQMQLQALQLQQMMQQMLLLQQQQPLGGSSAIPAPVGLPLGMPGLLGGLPALSPSPLTTASPEVLAAQVAALQLQLQQLQQVIKK